MVELEKSSEPKTSSWMIIAGITIAVILVIILVLIYNKISQKKTKPLSKPVQKTVNFLDEQIPSDRNEEVQIEEVASQEGLTLDELKGITVKEIAFNSEAAESDSVVNAAIRNARKAALSSQLSNNLVLQKKETEAKAEAEARATTAKTFASYVAAKGGLMELEEPIPYIVVDGKAISAPGLGALGYYEKDGALRKGYGAGLYNTKSYYGYNPYDKNTSDVLPYENTLLGYSGAPSGSGAVVVDVTNEGTPEMVDDEMAGKVGDFKKGDLVGIYEGAGYYSDAVLYADGINVTNELDTIALADVIAEEAEVEYQEELQKADGEKALASTGECSPLLIYEKFIGFVKDDEDSTTPIT